MSLKMYGSKRSECPKGRSAAFLFLVFCLEQCIRYAVHRKSSISSQWKWGNGIPVGRKPGRRLRMNMRGFASRTRCGLPRSRSPDLHFPTCVPARPRCRVLIGKPLLTSFLSGLDALGTADFHPSAPSAAQRQGRRPGQRKASPHNGRKGYEWRHRYRLEA